MPDMKIMGLSRLFDCFLLLCLSNLVLSFNVDTSQPLIFKDSDPKSFFGYSVALHKYKSMLIVGAPLSTQGVTKKGGTVFQCEIATQNCKLVPGLDKSLPNADNDAQWMGASVYSDGINVLACAPRSATKEVITAGKTVSRLHGKCISTNLLGADRSQDVLWKPCVNSYRTDAAFATCQVGFSSKYFGDGNGYHILSGLPNVASGAGLLAVDFSKGDNAGFTSNANRKLFEYIGYAATAGNIKVNKDNTTSSVGVGGAPRAQDLHGQVLMYDLSDTNFPLYTSAINDPSVPEQTGTYFGSAMSATDVNGDGPDDLIIGAPYYSGTKPNEGAVYVYINKGEAQGMVHKQTIYSSVCDPDASGKSRARALFGHAIGSVGDLNRDGYFDIAIGAPWGGENGKGVVCMFYGSYNDEPLQFKQLITAEINPGLDGFGYSFAEFYPYRLADENKKNKDINNDVDKNKYPDLAVGAYRSGHAVVLKSRPVATPTVTLNLGDTKQIDLLDSTVDMCTGPDNIKYKCIPKVELCFLLVGLGIGSSGGGVNYTFEVDSDQDVSKRAFMFENGKKVFVIKAINNVQPGSAPVCIQKQVFLTNNTKDIFRPMVVKVQWGYKPPDDASKCLNSLCPVANQMYQRTNEQKIPYVKGCNDDGNPICSSGLSLDMGYALDDGSKTISVGVTKEVLLKIEIKNSKENAFMNTLHVVYPDQLTPNNVLIENFAGVPIWDPNASQDKDEKTLIVTLNSPIGKDVSEKVTVVFGLLSVSKNDIITLKAQVKTESDDDIGNDQKSLQIGVSLKANLTVSGRVLPEQIKWKQGMTDINKRGPQIKHTFYFQNKGPSSVDTSSVLINFPEKINDQLVLNIYRVTLEGDDKRGTVGTCVHGKLNILGLDNKDGGTTTSNTTLKRKRRDAEDEVPDLEKGTSQGVGVKNQSCGGGVACRQITCTLNLLLNNRGVTIEIYSTLVEATFENEKGTSQDIDVKNQHIKDSRDIIVSAKFTSTAVEKPDNAPPDTITVALSVLSPYLTKEKKGDPIAWWIILLCILAAIIIIALIVFVMYKKGFFKRKRMEDDQPGEEDALRDGDPDDDE